MFLEKTELPKKKKKIGTPLDLIVIFAVSAVAVGTHGTLPALPRAVAT